MPPLLRNCVLNNMDLESAYLPPFCTTRLEMRILRRESL